MLVSLIKNLENLDVILASASPRRFELLNMIGLKFRVVESRVKEGNINPRELQEGVKANAQKKGLAVAEEYPDSLVICADTIVVKNNRIMGKPVDEADARNMLEQLSGATHKVITAFGLIHYNSQKSLYDLAVTEVTFRKLCSEEIMAYISTGEPMDKAGAYGIQGQGSLLIEKINGCYFNVVGFPLSRFFVKMDEFLNDFKFNG
jgi:septum formation protein